MKHILPIITLTTLAAAASAQSAASSGFNYNTVSLGYSVEDFKDVADEISLTSVTLSQKIGKNLVGTLGLHNGAIAGQGQDLRGFSVGLGYIYSVNSSLDIIVGASLTDLQSASYDSQSVNFNDIGVKARYNLGNGIELTAGLGRNVYGNEESASDDASDQNGAARNVYSLGAVYKVNADLSVSASYAWSKGISGTVDADSETWAVALVHSF
jgi:long-subunit fatty acid transport protein